MSHSIPVPGDDAVVYDLRNADYHACNAWLSKSSLDKLARAPALYRHSLDAPPEPPTPAMRRGTLVHTAILEPDMYAQAYAVAPACDRRTSAGKAVWGAFELTCGNREPITVDEHKAAQAMREAVLAHPAARRALSGVATVEASVFSALDDVPVRCRPDFWRADNLLVDVKTTSDASPDGFAKSCAQYRYHVQAALYTDIIERVTGTPVPGFVFVAVETAAPYLVAVYVASGAMLARGREAYRRDLATYRRCMDSGTWPGYSEQAMEIDLPRWAL
jgi:exodeoxyribonuclease VIII